MSQTVRLFVNDKRIATAVITKKGKFLQVYPTKKNFVSEDDWRSSWKHETHPQSRVENAESKAPPPNNATISTKNWTYKEVYRFTAPPGKYYIGDLCYVLGDDVYDKIGQSERLPENLARKYFQQLIVAVRRFTQPHLLSSYSGLRTIVLK
jgi:hypothetical protein